jgi:hypothetical protein
LLWDTRFDPLKPRAIAYCASRADVERVVRWARSERVHVVPRSGGHSYAGYSSGNGHYEQEMGDCDNDNDIDIYGLNWQVGGFNFNDISLTNNGAGVFGSLAVLPGSGSDDNEADFLDYDNDGDLDVYVANFSGQDRLYRNNFTGTTFSHMNVDSTEMAANTAFTRLVRPHDDGRHRRGGSPNTGQPEYFLKNSHNNADTIAPRLAHGQVSNRVASDADLSACSSNDNQSYYWHLAQPSVLQYRVVPGALFRRRCTTRRHELFRGTIPQSGRRRVLRGDRQSRQRRHLGDQEFRRSELPDNLQ